MKKNFIYALVGCLAFSLAACSDDPWDATSKHVYGPGDEPYIKTNTSATISTEFEILEDNVTDKQVIYLSEYADKFQSLLGMSVDQALSGLSDGSVVFCPMNLTKNIWMRNTASTQGKYGWHYSASSNICEADKGLYTVELDVAQKAIILSCASTIPLGGYSFNVGFAKDNGKDLDDYVRISNSFTVTNPRKVVVTAKLEAVDWARYEIKFSKFEEAIDFGMGVTPKEFTKMVNQGVDGPLYLILVDSEGNWDPNFEATDAYYSANGLGYWLTSESKQVGWNGDDMTYYAESFSGGLAVGRASGSAYNGKTIPLRLVYVLKEDQSKFVDFIISVVME